MHLDVIEYQITQVAVILLHHRFELMDWLGVALIVMGEVLIDFCFRRVVQKVLDLAIHLLINIV
jgi:hypothetical protein